MLIIRKGDIGYVGVYYVAAMLKKNTEKAETKEKLNICIKFSLFRHLPHISNQTIAKFLPINTQSLVCDALAD
jgi:hypothetical protein